MTRWTLPLLLASSCVAGDPDGAAPAAPPQPSGDTDELDQAPPRPTCGKFSESKFKVTLQTVIVFPTRLNGQPWDWEGDVPAPLRQALAELNEAVGQAQAAGDLAIAAQLAAPADASRAASTLLHLMDAYAPELLEGTVPPDLFAEGAYVSDHSWEALDYTELHYDTYAAEVAWTFYNVNLLPGEAFVIWVHEDDEGVREGVGGWSLDKQYLRSNAGCGLFALVGAGPGGLHMLLVQVD
jgi:hypothetical protein